MRNFTGQSTFFDKRRERKGGVKTKTVKAT